MNALTAIAPAVARGAAPTRLSARSAGFVAPKPVSAAVARPASTGRAVRLEVVAKGKVRGRQTAPGAQMMRNEPLMPPVDKDNEQFVIFVRSKMGLKRWVPINVITAGTQANLLVKGLESDLTKETSMNTLKREMAKVIYKEKQQIIDLTKRISMLKFAKELEFGMQVLNKETPKKTIMGEEGVIALPAEDQIEKTAVEGIAEGAATAFTSLQQGWSNLVGGAGQPAAGGKA